nr:MAG TPA: hypothetical protein [Caudoviricetes sp.]
MGVPYSCIFRGFGVCQSPVSWLVGGDCNNGFLVGASALNLNNLVSNTNWNIGAA